MDSSRLSSGRLVTRCPSSRLRSYIRPVRGRRLPPGQHGQSRTAGQSWCRRRAPGLLSACCGVGRTEGPWRGLTPDEVFCLPLTAGEAERRLRDALSRKFNELIFLRYRATNEAPYPFAWVDYTKPIVTTVQP